MTSDLDLTADVADLDPDEARAQAEALQEQLRRHSYLYYVEARPEISDEEYDERFRRLQALEERWPELATDDSPTRRVGAEPQDAFESREHLAPMLSLDSTKEEADLRRFHDRILKALSSDLGEEDDPPEPTYLLEPKLDGASIELVYEDGVFVRAVTRGNGRVGEDVTENIRTIPSVPLRLRADERPVPPVVAFRGEVMMYISDFEAFNARLAEEGREPYASPRNSAAGSIRQLDPGITAARTLDVLVYDVLHVEGEEFATDTEGVEAIRQWGLKLPERIETVSTPEEILAYHAAFVEERDELDYEIDGVVIKLDDLAKRREMGVTSHHPRWALAFKFEPRKEVTKIERIGIQVGRTGVLTPVAFLRPVVVGGVTISRASLHNREELKRKDIREGDTVRIQRAGDVIPQVVEVVDHEDDREEPFRMPEACPACDTPVVEDGPRTVCPNRFGCPAQLKGRIQHYGARSALDIEGLGEETANLLVDRDLVEELAGLYDLRAEQLTPLEGFAEKSATALVEAIQGTKEPELERFLVALGIPEVGVAVARDLARHFGSLERIRGAGPEELAAVHGVGPIMSETITAFLADERNAAAIDHILERGVRPTESEPVDTAEEAADEKPAVFTGSLPVSRKAAQEAWLAVGGQTAGSVSGNTGFLVAGEGAGSKLDKAEKLGVEVLGWEEFVARLEERGGSLEGEE